VIFYRGLTVSTETSWTQVVRNVELIGRCSVSDHAGETTRSRRYQMKTEEQKATLVFVSERLRNEGPDLIAEARAKLPPGMYDAPFALAFMNPNVLLDVGRAIAEALIWLGGAAAGVDASITIWKKVKALLQSEDEELTPAERTLRVLMQRDRDGEYGVPVSDIRAWLAGGLGDSTIRRTLATLAERGLAKPSPFRLRHGATHWFYTGPGSHFIRFGHTQCPELYELVMDGGESMRSDDRSSAE